MNWIGSRVSRELFPCTYLDVLRIRIEEYHSGRSGDERCHIFVDDNTLLCLGGELDQCARSARYGPR